jgi:ADP-ribose pyrophosphatase YjhB (NUDIX family)
VGNLPAPWVKVKVFAVLLDRARERHLVWRGADGERPFHRPLGGHLEFGETTEQCIVREVQEELGTELLAPRLLGVLEAIFEYGGGPGHEIVFVYHGELADPDLVGPEGAWISDNDVPIWVEWRPVDDAGLDVPLYPDGLGELVERARRRGILGE